MYPVHGLRPRLPGQWYYHQIQGGKRMSDDGLLAKTYNFILSRMVDTGQAPHYTEIASELGLSVEEGRKALHDLINAGIPGWLFPETDILVSMAPFNNLPNQYRITIDGQQKWFGQ
jgi:hypothetical protein